MRTEGLKGALSPRLVAVSIAALLLAMTLAFMGSSSSTHDATVSMVPVNSKAGENIGYTLTVTNASGDNIDNVTLEVPLDEGGNARYRVATPVPAPENWTSEIPENDGFGYAKKITWRTDDPLAHIAAGGSDNFTFTAATPLYYKTYTWTCGTSDISGYVDNDNITTRVDSVPPGPPTLVWPDNDENINDNTLNLDWDAVTENSLPVTYDLLVDDDPDFLSPEVDVTGIATDNYVTVELGENTWNWKVKARDNAGNIGPWSSPRSFRVDITPPESPTLVWPADGENISDNTPNLDWNPVVDPSMPVTYDLMFDWLKRRPITISGSHPENYQIKVVLPFYDNSIRFLESETAGSLPYWVENYTADNMMIWVRRLENADNQFYVYYSNSGVGNVENGENTFIFFDDFLGTSIDTRKWTTHSGAPSVLGSIVTVERTGGNVRISVIDDWTTPIVMRTHAKITASKGGVIGIGAGNGSAPYCIAAYFVTHIAVSHDGDPEAQSADFSKSAGSWYVYEIKVKAGSQKYYLDNALDVSHGEPGDFGEISPTIEAADANGAKVEADWVLVRKFTDSEPTAAVGEEELTTQTRITDDNYQITMEPSEGIWHWKVRTVDNVGNVGIWSPLRSFRVDITPPPAPTLLAPADKTKTCDNTPTFGWTAITIENSLLITYYLQVDNDNNFLSPEVNVTGLTENMYTPPSELLNGYYSWHVRARDNAGNWSENWSDVWLLLIHSTPHDATVILAPINSKPGISIDYLLTVTNDATGDNIDNVTLELPLDENSNSRYRVAGSIPAPPGWTSEIPEIDFFGYARKVRWWTDNTWAHIAAGESENFTFTATTPLYDGAYTWTCLTRDIIDYIDNDSITTRVATTAWQLIETWTGAVEAPAAWQLVETWTGTIETPSWAGTAFFRLKNLYTVDVEKILDLYQGSKLVVKFYAYGDGYENENVIENFSPPWHVEENESARHPEGIGVKKARLDLTIDNTQEVISTIASFVVQKVNLEIRFTEIPLEWALAPTPEEKVELEIEFSEIPLYWALAPS